MNHICKFMKIKDFSKIIIELSDEYEAHSYSILIFRSLVFNLNKINIEIIYNILIKI